MVKKTTTVCMLNRFHPIPERYGQNYYMNIAHQYDDAR